MQSSFLMVRYSDKPPSILDMCQTGSYFLMLSPAMAVRVSVSASLAMP